MLRLRFKQSAWCAHLHQGMIRHQTMSTPTAQDECMRKQRFAWSNKLAGMKWVLFSVIWKEACVISELLKDSHKHFNPPKSTNSQVLITKPHFCIKHALILRLEVVVAFYKLKRSLNKIEVTTTFSLTLQM